MNRASTWISVGVALFVSSPGVKLPQFPRRTPSVCRLSTEVRDGPATHALQGASSSQRTDPRLCPARWDGRLLRGHHMGAPAHFLREPVALASLCSDPRTEAEGQVLELVPSRGRCGRPPCSVPLCSAVSGKVGL